MSGLQPKLIGKSDITGGTLAHVVPLHVSSLLFLVGGGRSPRYPPNKVIFWDDALGREVAELEFRERVRGVKCRRGWLAVALRRRVVVFQVDGTISRYAEWDTCDNARGEHLLQGDREISDLASSIFCRSTCHSHQDTCYLTSYSWSADWSRPTYTPTPM